MSITDYASLQSSLATWAFRTGDTEFAAAAPDFVAGAERVMNYGLEHPDPSRCISPLRVSEMETVATASLTDSQADLPADYLQYRSIVGNGNGGVVDLEVKDPAWIAARYPSGLGSVCGRYATIQGNTVTVYDPSITSLTLSYYAKIPALSDSNTTNWILTKVPDAYLEGALWRASIFMKDMEARQLHFEEFKMALDGLRQSDVGARHARVVSRVRGATP